MPNLEQQFRNEEQAKIDEMFNEYQRLQKTTPTSFEGQTLVNPLDRQQAISGLTSQIGSEAQFAGGLADTLQSRRESAASGGGASGSGRSLSEKQQALTDLVESLTKVGDSFQGKVAAMTGYLKKYPRYAGDIRSIFKALYGVNYGDFFKAEKETKEDKKAVSKQDARSLLLSEPESPSLVDQVFGLFGLRGK